MKLHVLFLLLSLPAWSADTINAGHPRLWLTPAIITNIHSHFVISGGGTACTPDSIGSAFLANADIIYNQGHSAAYGIFSLAAAYVALTNLSGDTTGGAACDPAGHTAVAFAAQAVSDYIFTANQYITANCPGGVISGCWGTTPVTNPYVQGSPLQPEIFALTYDWLQYSSDQWGSNKAAASAFLQVTSIGLQGTSTISMGAECPQGDDIQPNDNECLSNYLTIVMFSIAMYGDGCTGTTNAGCLNSNVVSSVTLGDNLNRTGGANTGGNSQLDWAMNDSTYGARNFLIPYYATGRGAGGIMEEGFYGYGDYAYLARLFVSASTGTNVSFTSLIPNLWTEMLNWDQHVTVQSPDLLSCFVTNPACGATPEYYWLQFSSDGGHPYGNSEEHRAGLLMASASIFGTAPLGDQARGYLTNKLPTYPSDTLEYSVYDLIYKNYPNTNTASYTTLNYFSNANCSNPFNNSCGNGWVSARTSNTPSASTQFTAHCGTPRVRHGTSSSCNVFLWRKGRWLIGAIPTYGEGSTFQTSLDLSSLLIRQGAGDNNGSGTYLWKAYSQNADGQAYVDRYESVSGDQYVYFHAQLASAFNSSSGVLPTTYGTNNKVTSSSRACAFIKSGSYTVCMDRMVSSENVALMQLWQINTSGSDPVNGQVTPTPAVPTVVGKVISSLDVDQKLYITSVFPSTSTVSVNPLNDEQGTTGTSASTVANANTQTLNGSAVPQPLTLTVPSGLTGFAAGTPIGLYSTANSLNAYVTSYSGTSLVTSVYQVVTGDGTTATTSWYVNKNLNDFENIGFLPFRPYSTGGCFTSNGFTSCLDQSFFVRRYQGRVGTATGGATATSPNQFILTTLQGDDATGGIGQTPITGITSSNYSGAHIKDPATNWVVGGSNIPAGTSLTLPISYTYTRTTTNANNLIADMPVSTNVKVTISSGTVSVCAASAGGCTGTAFTTSANATLAFTDSNGTPIPLSSAPSVSPATLPNATIGTSYPQTLTASSFAGTVTWSLHTGTAPTGLTGTCLSGTTGATCTLSGTLTATGTFNFTIRATDGTSTVDTPYTVVINASPSFTITCPLTSGTIGVAYSNTLTETGGTSPFTWSNLGALQSGLSFSSAGVISGTPTATGTATLIIHLVDASNASPPDLTCNLTINPITPPPGVNGVLSGTTTLNGQTVFKE